MEAITIKYHDLTDCRPYQIWEGELCEPPPILEILEKESWFFLTFFSCLDSKTIEGRTYLSFNFVRFSFILFCQIYSSNYIIQLNLSSEIFAVWYLQSWSHSVKVVEWGAHKRLGICVSYFLSFPFAFLLLEKLPHTLLQCSVPEGDLHCQCILSIFPASVHQFYANILVFVNINPFLYINDQFALLKPKRKPDVLDANS